MKKLVLTLGVAALAVGAMAQGTIQFQNSAISSPINTNNAAGTAKGKLVGGFTPALSIGLFWGTTAGNVTTLAGLESIGATPGVLAGNTSFVVNGALPGDTDYFQVIAWDSSYGAGAAGAAAAFQAGGYYGSTAILPFLLGPATGPGTQLFGSSSSTTLLHGFDVVPTPEPTTLALGGLGAAALLLFRRKK